MQQCCALHPCADPPQIPPTDVAPICITAETLNEVLTRLRRGTAPCLTAWTYEHILEATHDPSGRRICITFHKHMLAGRLPHVPDLLDSDGLILRKPAGASGPSPSGKPGCASPPCAQCMSTKTSSRAMLRCNSEWVCQEEPKVAAMPSAPPSTHTTTIYSYPWAARAPITVSRARQSFTQLSNTPRLPSFSLLGVPQPVASLPLKGATRLLPGPLHHQREAGGPARPPPVRPHASRIPLTCSHNKPRSSHCRLLSQH
jgi:hypothetical protein